MADAKGLIKNPEVEPIYTPSQFARELEVHIKANMPLLCTGSPGQGKTTIVDQVCKKIGADLLITHPVVDSPIDYKGMPAIIEVMMKPNGKGSRAKKTKTAEFLPFADLKKLIDANTLTVHFADDLGPSAKMVQAAYGQLLLNRAINAHTISEHIRFVAATNRKQDKSGVQGIIEMLKDRFHTICELQNSLEDWVFWAISKKTIPYELISYVRYRPEVLDDFEPTPDMSRTATPRGLEQIADKMNAGIPVDLQLKSFAGTIGKQRASEFVGFLTMYQNLPDPDEVIKNPMKALIPNPKDKPGNLYALCGALASRATTKTISNIIKYARRLPAEFSALLVNDATSRDIKLCNNDQFIEWAADQYGCHVH
jgi:hypothetical protein